MYAAAAPHGPQPAGGGGSTHPAGRIAARRLSGRGLATGWPAGRRTPCTLRRTSRRASWRSTLPSVCSNHFRHPRKVPAYPRAKTRARVPAPPHGQVAQQAFMSPRVAQTCRGEQSASAPQPTWTQNPPFTQTRDGGRLIDVLQALSGGTASPACRTEGRAARRVRERRARRRAGRGRGGGEWRTGNTQDAQQGNHDHSGGDGGRRHRFPRFL